MDNKNYDKNPNLGEHVNAMNRLIESQPIEKVTKVSLSQKNGEKTNLGDTGRRVNKINRLTESQPIESKLLKRLKPDELRKEVDELNKELEPSNGDEELLKGLKKKKPWYETPTEEEKNTVPNPEEEAFFKELRERDQEDAVPVVPPPPTEERKQGKPLEEIINPKKTMSERNEISGEKIAKLQQQAEREGNNPPAVLENIEVEKPNTPTSISGVTSKEAYKEEFGKRAVEQLKEQQKKNGGEENGESQQEKVKRLFRSDQNKTV